MVQVAHVNDVGLDAAKHICEALINPGSAIAILLRGLLQRCKTMRGSSGSRSVRSR